MYAFYKRSEKTQYSQSNPLSGDDIEMLSKLYQILDLYKIEREQNAQVKFK